MGNRGIIHDPATRRLLRRRWTSKAWIICLCAFKGVRRRVMGGRSWTELFFLDEATALAAGHRPCFFCRREAAEAFRAAWAKGNGGAKPRAAEMDETLHRERLDARAEAPAFIARGRRGSAGWGDAGGWQCGLSDRRRQGLALVAIGLWGRGSVAGGGRPASDPALHGPRLGRGLFRGSPSHGGKTSASRCRCGYSLLVMTSGLLREPTKK